MKKYQCLSLMTLKRIALITMFIDHATLFLFTLTPLYDTELGASLYELGRNIGRLAFPLYCFMISEGAIHTRNRARYALRLLLFALISVIPFSLVNDGVLFSTKGQNVLFELLLGLLCIYVYDYFSAKSKVLGVIGLICAMIIASAIGFIIAADYFCLGIYLIVAFYLCRNMSLERIPICCAVFVFGTWMLYFMYYFRFFTSPVLSEAVSYAWRCISLELWGIVSIFLLPFYNGTKGKTLSPQFYYWFYPGHLLLMYLIRVLVLH